MDSIFDLLFFIAILYGFIRKMKKGTQKTKETSQPPRQIRANHESFLDNKKASSTLDLDWEQYEENVFTEYTKERGAGLSQQEIKREEPLIKQPEKQMKNIIKEKQVADEIYKAEIGSPKISFRRSTIMEAIIMAEILGKPKALKR